MAKKSFVERLGETQWGQAQKETMAKDTSAKAWLANGLDELRQAVALGTDQVMPGSQPGSFGTVTHGEATAERLNEADQTSPAGPDPQAAQAAEAQPEQPEPEM